MGLFALIKAFSFAVSFFKTSQLHEFLLISAQNKNIWSFCAEVKRFWKTFTLFDSILEQIGYRYEMNRSLRFICTILFWVMTIFTSCHFACMHQRGVPAILMAYDITKFIIFFFILIQSCKITIYIFHLEELGD